MPQSSSSSPSLPCSFTSIWAGRSAFLFCVLVLAFTACSVSEPAVPARPAIARAIIFVPGFKGSTLVDRHDQSTRWLTAYEALFGLNTLAIREADSLEAKEVLRDISTLWGLISYNAYGDWLDDLTDAAGENIRIVPLAFDWRKDDFLAVQALDEAVRGLQSLGVEEIDIVAHSMGGMILAYYLRYGAQNPEGAVENWAGAAKISKAATIAVPFRGTVKLLRDFQYDAAVGRNLTLLSAAAVQTFTSAYQMLPLRGEQVLLTPDGQILDLDWFSIDVWRRYHWPMINGMRGQLIPTELPGNLRRGEAFLQLLNRDGEHEAKKPCELLAIRGKGIATGDKCYLLEQPVGAMVCDQEAAEARNVDLNLRALLTDGDGIVSVKSSKLPEPYALSLHTEEQIYPGQHLALLTNRAVQKKLFNFLELPNLR